MSIDMSQFYQVFFEESAEHLASMESLLLALDLDAPDDDQLNAIFRAAHSIKGGSGTFGFNDMAEVTHVLETLLDGIRKHEIAITADMVDAFLVAGDVLRELLEAHQNGTVADLSAAEEICARLAALTAAGSTQSVGDTPDVPHAGTAEGSQQSVGVPPDVPHRLKQEARSATMFSGEDPCDLAGAAARSLRSDDVRNGAEHLYRIRFDCSPAVFPDRTYLDNLLEDIANLGRVEHQQVTPDSVSLELTTPLPAGDVTEIFSFFLSPGQLDFTEAGMPESQSDDRDPGYGFFDEPAPGDDPGFGFFETPESCDDQGYGFFVEPEQVKSDIEQGYGFFVEPEQIKSDIENEQGYGFFIDLPAPVSDAVAKAPAHRRATDKAPSAADSSIRVSVEKVDQMINLVGELVITQSMLAETASHLDPVLHERLVNGLAQLERNTRELQESVMSVRMMPINFVFSRFPRLVRDLAAKLGKKVQLKLVGEGTELDKGLIEKISDPLTHLVRNSLDHGIEMPEVRQASGKDAQGTIILRAAHQGGNVVIEVQDDGAGLNRDRILSKAREKGLPAGENMTDAEVWSLIFAPGFSTAEVITDVSGRGVGMDVVKKNIEGMGGRVEISSRQGLGSTITIRLPLTLAIVDGLSISVGDQVYIVPLSFISESLQPAACDIKGISGHGQVVQVRGEYLPLVALHQVFNIEPRITEPAQGILVLLEAEGRKIALFVDDLIAQHQVVIKSLETNYRKVPGVSGATIMGDGRVAMILDVGALVKLAQG